MADPSGVICFWSAGAERAFGYPAAEAVGQTLDLIVPPEHREAHWNGFRRAIESGAASVEGQSIPFPARCAGGDVAARPGRLTLVRRPRGQVIAALVVFD
jgi:PAS domain S-box-containing protein